MRVVLLIVHAYSEWAFFAADYVHTASIPIEFSFAALEEAVELHDIRFYCRVHGCKMLFELTFAR